MRAWAYFNQVSERTVKQVIEQACEKAAIPYMRNRDVKFVKTKDGNIIPAPIGESQRGKPDLTIVLNDGRTMWIETKSSDGRLSQDQIRWRDDLIKNGHLYRAPRSIAEAHDIVQTLLAERGY